MVSMGREGIFPRIKRVLNLRPMKYNEFNALVDCYNILLNSSKKDAESNQIEVRFFFFLVERVRRYLAMMSGVLISSSRTHWLYSEGQPFHLTKK